jgi:predicted N-acyltransferase
MKLTLRFLDDLTPHAPAWDALLARQDAPTPFMRASFLQALGRTGAACPETGWQLLWPTLWEGDTLLATAPLAIKGHSWGEFVFDQAWARAYAQHGLQYYPKAVVAVPFTPVPGSRLLAVDDAHRALLARALRDWTEAQGLSGLHLLFGSEADARALRELNFATREQPQFHWQRDPAWASFDDFLAAMKRDKRKKIQQERRHVRDAGVQVRVVAGEAITEADWAFFYRCYARTYALRGNPPYLPEGFFQQAFPEPRGGDRWVLLIAEHEGAPIAASLLAQSADGSTVYGRHWGAVLDLPFLHFELCYYAPLAWCIANGVQCFEGGAQGEHKMARGLLPVPTQSQHWLADPRFADAVGRFAEEEQAAVAAYEAELAARSPFKPVQPGA